MCGILGLSGWQRDFHHELLKGLKKRGPDEIGFWTDGQMHMAHARLAIIGLDESSVEPMANDRHVLIYNGEIYNFGEIRCELEAAGVNCSGANDARVLLEAWTFFGEQILTKLHGFWAFAVYDKQTKRLTLVRDQLGIKPLYYWQSSDGIAVSSLIKTLLDSVPESPDFDYQAISEYAQYQFTFGDKTFVKQIRKVQPGHIVEVDVNTREIISTRCYEDIFKPQESQIQTYSPEWLEETREILKNCVRESTISDTSFTTFCSGGIDSSLITALTKPELAYHCNYSDPDCNETFFAQRVVEDMDTRLFVVNASEEFDLVEKLQDIVSDFDELSIGSVILPLDDLLSQVKRRFKVILTGSGGDELFAGYMRYMLAIGMCNQDSYRALFNKVRALETPAERFELCHRKGDTSLYKFFDDSVRQTFYSEFEKCQYDSNELRSMLRFDQRFFLAGLLNIDDKMCGRHSLESRPSLLHQKLFRRVQALEADPGAFLRDGTLKPMMRDIAEGILPSDVIHRKDKMGFTTPIGTFINNSADKVRERIFDSHFREFYDLKQVNFTAETKYSREVFGLLMLDLWFEEYMRFDQPRLSESIEIVVEKRKVAEEDPPTSPQTATSKEVNNR